MKFSTVVDYRGQPFFVCKTGRKNIRILDPDKSYEHSFVVPIGHTSNRRSAGTIEVPEGLPADFDSAEFLPR